MIIFSAPASPPDNITAMIVSSTEIMVTWDIVPPIDQNGVITMYKVRYEPLETFSGQIQAQTANTTGAETSELLINLEEFVKYNISVQAYTSEGEGPYSADITAMTQEDSK